MCACMGNVSTTCPVLPGKGSKGGSGGICLLRSLIAEGMKLTPAAVCFETGAAYLLLEGRI